MKPHYNDIRSRINEPPKWWDENGVPRYVEFHPYEVANIYAEEAVLLEIRCQSCKTPFVVAMSADHLKHTAELQEAIKEGWIHYGDPPNAGCCLGGATMNCEDVRVLQYWRNTGRGEWARDSGLEIELPDAKEIA